MFVSLQSVQDIMSALAKGGASGLPGSLNVSSISIAELDAAALKSISTGAGKSAASRVRRLKSLIGCIRPLRCAQRAHDWSEVDSVVETLVAALPSLGDAVDVCRSEVDLAFADVEHRRLLARISSAFATGMVRRPAGPGPSHVDTTTVTCDALQAVLNSLSSLPPLLTTHMPDRTNALIATVRMVLTCRSAVIEHDWEAAHVAASALLIEDIPADVRTEMTTVIAEAKYRQLVQSLQTGICSGCIVDNPIGYATALTSISVDAITDATRAVAEATVVRVTWTDIWCID
jgi:hypothetical protein